MKIDRRTTLTAAMASGVTTLMNLPEPPLQDSELTKDQQFVVAAGMTEDEADLLEEGC